MTSANLRFYQIYGSCLNFFTLSKIGSFTVMPKKGIFSYFVRNEEFDFYDEHFIKNSIYLSFGSICVGRFDSVCYITILWNQLIPTVSQIYENLACRTRIDFGYCSTIIFSRNTDCPLACFNIHTPNFLICVFFTFTVTQNFHLICIHANFSFFNFYNLFCFPSSVREILFHMDSGIHVYNVCNHSTTRTSKKACGC